MHSSDETMNAARAALARSRSRAEPAPCTFNDKLVRGAALGAVASLPFAGIGLIGGAVIGVGVAALDEFYKGLIRFALPLLADMKRAR